MATQAQPGSADPTNSFISQFQLAGSGSGPLSGQTLAVKDLYDIAGHKTGFGNPTWLQTHEPANDTAPTVSALLAAGATIIGKTHMDEMAYSLAGENAYYGTPLNVAAPGRIPGGSSSGSAAAVAAGQADIGLGSDTGGSVRVPASYCGIFGMRPTHGRIPLTLAVPLAPSFDTCGWFTRDASLLQQVGQILLSLSNPNGSSSSSTNSSGSSLDKPRWLVAKDAFALAQPATTQAIYDALSGSSFANVTAVLGSPNEVAVASGGELEAEGVGKLDEWPSVFIVTQAYEVWQTHGSWVTQHQPRFGPGIAERFKMASGITTEQWQAANAKRQSIKQHILQLLGSDGVLALPTCPGPAVPCNTPPAQLEDWRRASLSMTSIAGLAGLPQVTLPIAAVDGLPVGLSLIGPPGSDEGLLALAVKLTAALRT